MSDRTEQATPKRREDARQKGQMARSSRLPAALLFLSVAFVLNETGSDWVSRGKRLIALALHRATAPVPLTPEAVHHLLVQSIALLAPPVLLVMGVALLVSVGTNGLQTQGNLTPQAFARGPERLNPVTNLKQLVSSQPVVELLKSLLELSCLALASYGVLAQGLRLAPTLVGAPANRMLSILGDLAYGLSLRMGGALVVCGVLDYGYQWYRHEKSLRMTKQEVRDEFRQQEGDPLVKGQRRRAARALVQRRLQLEVPRADVVITNPTHFAVALAYDREKNTAPVVVAKGADHNALRIRRIALECGVEIVENPPLARSLYRSAEPGQTIPPEFFRAVAEVLAYVYRLRVLSPQDGPAPSSETGF